MISDTAWGKALQRQAGISVDLSRHRSKKANMEKRSHACAPRPTAALLAYLLPRLNVTSAVRAAISSRKRKRWQRTNIAHTHLFALSPSLVLPLFSLAAADRRVDRGIADCSWIECMCALCVCIYYGMCSQQVMQTVRERPGLFLFLSLLYARRQRERLKLKRKRRAT